MVFPSLYDAVETVSADSQGTFLRVRGAEYSALVLAAAFGLMPNGELGHVGALAAVAFFLAALVLRLSGAGETAEKRWYDARAAAESIKSSSWQYAVGGGAFPLTDVSSSQRFVDFLHGVLNTLPHLDVPAEARTGLAVTSEMNAIRTSDRPQRTAVYVVERVEDQLRWYESKANLNKRRARQWRRALVLAEAAAVAVGLLRVANVFDVDWLALLAAVAASIAAWQQLKNYTSLSEAYSVTSHEVQLVNSSLGAQANESDWAQAVADAETAFSREHTLWLSRRQRPQ